MGEDGSGGSSRDMGEIQERGTAVEEGGGQVFEHAHGLVHWSGTGKHETGGKSGETVAAGQPAVSSTSGTALAL